MPFTAQTNSANEWKIIVNAIAVLVEEASFEATPEGIEFRGMDPSHVAMIDLNWPNASFEKYECDKPCLLYTSPSPRDDTLSRMPSSA